MAERAEDTAYGFYILFSKSLLDSSLVHSCERCYDVMHSYKNNHCIGLRDQVTESLDSHFLRFSTNCQNCFASINLRNKKYVAFNKQYSKEDYQELMQQYDFGSYKTYQQIQNDVEEHWKKFPPDPDVSYGYSVDYTGSYVFQSKNCKECYEVVGAENCKYLWLTFTGPITDSYDISNWGQNLDFSYDCCNVGLQASGLRFCNEAGHGLRNAEYCKQTYASSNVFGCVSVGNSEYVILNKRYTKEDFESLRAKIIEHMKAMPYQDKMGNVYTYGEFFPMELSPFSYNVSIAYQLFTVSKKEAIERGLTWRDHDKTEYGTTMQAKDLPDHIKDAPESIIKEVIACIKCARGYRVIPWELEFRKSMNVPLSRECPFCRIDAKFQKRLHNLNLVERTCAQCGAKFPTPHTVEDAPHILCKSCYLKEVV